MSIELPPLLVESKVLIIIISWYWLVPSAFAYGALDGLLGRDANATESALVNVEPALFIASTLNLYILPMTLDGVGSDRTTVVLWILGSLSTSEVT